MKNYAAAALIVCAGILTIASDSAAESASSSVASDSKIETQLIRCAAVYYIISGTAGSDKNNEKKFRDMAANFSLVYASEKNNQLKSSELQARRDLIVRDLVDNYPSRRDALHEEAVLCGAWYEGFQFQEEKYAFMPVIPKVIPGKVREDYTALANAAFKEWVNSGFTLPRR